MAPGAGQTGAGPASGPATPVGPDGTGGTSPGLPYPPWASPSTAGGGPSPWTGTPPGDPPPGGRHRRPAWIALVLLLVLILAGVATVFLTERGNADDTPARSAGILTHSTTDTGTLRVR